MAHPDLHIHLVWGRGFEHLISSAHILELARQCADTPSTLNKPPTLRYLKAEAKLKAGSAWRQLLHRYYNEHPHSPATRATAHWQPHSTSNLLKKLGHNRGISALTTQTILGKGPFPEYLSGINDTDVDTQCLCGATESRTHILTECPLTLPHCAAAWRTSPLQQEQDWFYPHTLRALTRLVSYLPLYGRTGIRQLSTGQDQPPDQWWYLLKLTN